MLYAMGSLGLPGIAGFVGEFLVMQGAFRVNGWFSFVASLVIIFASVYLLWLYQRVFFGKVGDYDPAVASGHGHGHVSTTDLNRAGTDTLPEKGSGHGTPHEGHDNTAHGHHADPDILANGAKFPDLNLPEGLALIPMGILAIVVGVVPALILDFLTASGSNLAVTMVEHSDKLAAIVQLVSK
jgi:NADH:ubiquinone oxidoreductase subunit 4 (subunit M)